MRGSWSSPPGRPVYQYVASAGGGTGIVRETGQIAHSSMCRAFRDDGDLALPVSRGSLWVLDGVRPDRCARSRSTQRHDTRGGQCRLRRNPGTYRACARVADVLPMTGRWFAYLVPHGGGRRRLFAAADRQRQRHGTSRRAPFGGRPAGRMERDQRRARGDLEHEDGAGALSERDQRNAATRDSGRGRHADRRRAPAAHDAGDAARPEDL